MSDRGPQPPFSDADAPEVSVEQPAGADSHAQPFEIGEQPFSLTGFDDPDAESTEQPRSKVRRIVLFSLLAVGVAGAGALIYASLQVSSQKDATLTAPVEIGTLRLDNSEEGKSTADYLQTALSAEIDLDKAVGAVYADSAGQNVLFLGGTGLIWSPESDLKTAFGLISDNQGAVNGLHDVDAGKLGGTMKCGTTESDDGAISVCGWADHGSIALAMFPDRAEPDSAKLLLQIRDATQTRN
ncbi:hypothetical protein ACWKSP_23380 [Micromonosporaceae bacterium Da 78-11]